MRHIREAVTIPRRTRGLRRRVSDEKKAFAARLRRNPTRAAAILWDVLRGQRLGHKFRRRAVLYGWIPDFWCPGSRVAIDIDYASDRLRAQEHKRRDDILAQHAIAVVRIPAARIFQEIDQVARELKASLG